MSEATSIPHSGAAPPQVTQRPGLLQSLHQTSRVIAAAHDEQAVGQALMGFAARGDVHVARLLIFSDFVDGRPTTIEMREGWTIDNRPAQPYGTRLPLADYPLMEYMHADATVVCENVSTDERVNEPTRQLMTLASLGSFVTIPLTAGQHWLGALFVGRNTPSTYAEELIYAWWTLATQAAAALQNARLFEQAQHRSIQLQTAAEVSRAASSILDPLQLIQQVVDLVRERFDLYYVGLFLNDETGEWTDEPGRWAVLRAGTGEAGRIQLERGHKLEIGSESMIGWCVANAQARIALDVAEERTRFVNPLLPETRSEMALPLISRGQVIGAMTIQSTRQAAFSEEDISVLQTMADQLANAIQNARLFEHTQAALAEAQATHRRYLRQEWESLLTRDSPRPLGYLDGPDGLTAADDFWTPEIEWAVAAGELITLSDQGHDDEAPRRNALALPIKLRDQTIGVLDFYDKEHIWTEEDKAIVQTLADQVSLALENARLFEKTQRIASRERLAGEIVGKIRAAGDVQSILETAAQELGRVLGVSRARVHLGHPSDGSTERSTEAQPEGRSRRRLAEVSVGDLTDASPLTQMPARRVGNLTNEDTRISEKRIDDAYPD